MELEKLTKKEILTELYRLKSENIDLKNNQKKIWDNIKILITKISHEMKTPLNSIIGFSEIFKYRNLDTKSLEYIDNILISSKYLLSLVQNVIDITKSQNRKLSLSYSIFNSKDAIEEVITSFDTKNINYTLIDITITADYTRFKQVVYNLISNAIKYGKKNNFIRIITYEENNYFFFEISDNGDGIKEDDYNKIFEFYTQVSTDKNKQDIGIGLGLALCKAIIQAHNGNITVKSKINKGSTFIFKIPINNLQ